MRYINLDNDGIRQINHVDQIECDSDQRTARTALKSFRFAITTIADPKSSCNTSRVSLEYECFRLQAVDLVC